MRKISFDKVFNIVNICLLVLIGIVMLYPLYFTVIASFSEPTDVVTGKVIFWVKGFTLDCYEQVLAESSIWVGYRNSIIYTLLGTILSLVLTIPAAYAMSKKTLPMRSAFSIYYAITMFFSGGLLPTYLLVKDLNLLNKPYTLIILGSFSVYNMIVARTYFSSSIPDTLYEAAEIDGCSEFGKFLKIAIPLAKPIIAVIALYYAVARWNDYFTGMIYISKSDYYPLQLVLKNILLDNQARLENLTSQGQMVGDEQMRYLVRRAYMAEAMKYAVIFISSVPMLILYPFVQKYFVKGVMVGSVKG